MVSVIRSRIFSKKGGEMHKLLVSGLMAGLAIIASIHGANAADAATSKEIWELNLTKGNKKRPSNFFRQEKSLDDAICAETLKKLNEYHKIDTYPLDVYSNLFSGNSHTVEWTPIKQEMWSGRAQFVHYAKSPHGAIFLRAMISPMADSNSLQIVRALAEIQEIKKFSANDYRVFFEGEEAIRQYLDFGTADSVKLIFPKFPWPLQRDQELMLLEPEKEIFIGMIMEGNPNRFCGKNYHIIASLGDTNSKRYFPLCHFVSVHPISCKK